MYLQQTTHGRDLLVRVTSSQSPDVFPEKVIIHFGLTGEVYLSLTRQEAEQVRDGIAAVLAGQAVTR